jgi:hypothetical protein
MGLKVELFDRHAEHVDESVPLCEHRLSDDIEWGDTVKVYADMELPGWLVTSKLVKAEAQVEVHLVSKKLIRIIINHADYLAALRAAEA